MNCSSPADVSFAYDVLYESNKLWARQRFMGVQTQQNPMDAWILQEILWDTQPDLLIETGTQNGGAALYYAAMMQLYNPNARVLTIDTQPVDQHKPLYAIPGFCSRVECKNATSNPLWNRHVEFLRGDSTSQSTLNYVSRVTRKAQRVMVVLDSWHSFAHVKREIAAYHHLVTPGQYLVVQDTKLDRLRGRPSAKAAARAFVAPSGPGHRTFIVDSTREYLLYTQHSEGYLRRRVT